MRYLPIIVGCFLLFATTLSCSAPESEPTSETINQAKSATVNALDISSTAYVVTVEDTIPLATYHTWKHNWDQHGSKWLDTAKLTAFTMPFVDFSQAGAEQGAVTSRLYLGLQSTSTGYEAKMAVVGVNEKNQDMVDYLKGQYAYDLSKACPPFCKD